MKKGNDEILLGVTKKDSDVVIISTSVFNTSFNIYSGYLTDKMATLLILQTEGFCPLWVNVEDPRVVYLTLQHL